MNLFLYPTDTVWGIGASIFDEEMTLNISKIKKTTPTKPLSIIFGELSDLRSFFNLPNFLENQFLENYFSLEATLGLPVSSLKREIPNWILHGSDWVGVRYLASAEIKEITKKVEAPISTTSLNLAGFAPCLSFNEATLFRDKYCRQAQILAGGGEVLSGEASSIITLKERCLSAKRITKDDIRIIREGRMIRSIETLFCL